MTAFSQATGCSLTESVAFCSEQPAMFDAVFTMLGDDHRKFAESASSAAKRIKEERERWKSEHSVTD